MNQRRIKYKPYASKPSVVFSPLQQLVLAIKTRHYSHVATYLEKCENLLHQPMYFGKNISHILAQYGDMKIAIQISNHFRQKKQLALYNKMHNILDNRGRSSLYFAARYNTPDVFHYHLTELNHPRIAYETTDIGETIRDAITINSRLSFIEKEYMKMILDDYFSHITLPPASLYQPWETFSTLHTQESKLHDATQATTLAMGITRMIIQKSETHLDANKYNFATFMKVRQVIKGLRTKFHKEAKSISAKFEDPQKQTLHILHLHLIQMLKYQMGNCGEYALLVMAILAGIAPEISSETIELNPGDHVVLGIPGAGSDLNDYTSWGETLICDSWAGDLFTAPDIPTKLNAYWTDEDAELNQNKIGPVNLNWHAIKIGYYKASAEDFPEDKYSDNPSSKLLQINVFKLAYENNNGLLLQDFLDYCDEHPELFTRTIKIFFEHVEYPNEPLLLLKFLDENGLAYLAKHFLHDGLTTKKACLNFYLMLICKYQHTEAFLHLSKLYADSEESQLAFFHKRTDNLFLSLLRKKDVCAARFLLMRGCVSPICIKTAFFVRGLSTESIRMLSNYSMSIDETEWLTLLKKDHPKNKTVIDAFHYLKRLKERTNNSFSEYKRCGFGLFDAAIIKNKTKLRTILLPLPTSPLIHSMISGPTLLDGDIMCIYEEVKRLLGFDCNNAPTNRSVSSSCPRKS
jgi:hypothetical protein